jgi:hypothetical protein
MHSKYKFLLLLYLLIFANIAQVNAQARSCQAITDTIAQSVCNEQPYSFNGRLLDSSGIYIDPLQSTGGCDSIIYLKLSFADSVPSAIWDTSWQAYGQTLVTVLPANASSYTWQTLNIVFDTPIATITGLDSNAASYNCGDSIQTVNWNGGSYPINYYALLRVILAFPTGCKDTTSWLMFDDCLTSIQAISNTSNISIYPNPTHDLLNIDCQITTSLPLKITILDLDGSIVSNVSTGKINAGMYNAKADVSNLANGVYILRFVSENESTNIRFVKD